MNCLRGHESVVQTVKPLARGKGGEGPVTEPAWPLETVWLLWWVTERSPHATPPPRRASGRFAS